MLRTVSGLVFKKPPYAASISRKVDMSKKRRKRKEKAFPLLSMILFHVQKDNNNRCLNQEKNCVPYAHSFERRDQYLLCS